MNAIKVLETIIKKLEDERELWHNNSKAIVISATNDVLNFTRSALAAARKEEQKKNIKK